MMKRSSTIGIGFLIAALGVGGIAMADGKKDGKRGEARRAEILEKYDANDDGKLDEQERDIVREERRAERIKPFDKDGNGELDEQEKAARKAKLQKKFEARVAARFQTLDANKDGALTIDEFKAGAKGRGKYGHGKGGAKQGK